MVTWIIFNNHLLEVGVTQNRETMALWTLTTVDLFHFIMCEDPREEKFIEITFGWGPGHIWLHTTLEGRWPHYMILEVCWDGLWTLSFGLSQFHGRGSWLVCEVALSGQFKVGWLIDCVLKFGGVGAWLSWLGDSCCVSPWSIWDSIAAAGILVPC